MTDSPFAVRGIIEGFYGKPWTHEQRLDMIAFVAERGMNTFVYAPKDDPLMRRDWREPYAGDELARVSELITSCTTNNVDFVYCLSPGLSIEYSSALDRESLLGKFDAIVGLGVRSFGLLLDDIPDRLQHPRDLQVFPDLVAAQVALVQNVFAHIAGAGSSGNRLFVCPTQYWGYGNEDYIRRFGSALDPRIELFWTGRAICSATLDRADADTFTYAAGRPPTYWDNYPVNDVAMTYELHVGPYRGRDPQLHLASSGIIANGMELFESSKIPFATVADYLADPHAYDPESSWRRAIEDVAGQDADAYRLFADNVRSSCLAEGDSPLLQQALERFAFERDYGDSEHAVDDLAGLAERMLTAANHLLHDTVANPQLIAESRRWIEAFSLGARAILHIVELYRSGRLETDGPKELTPFLNALRDARVRVFGDLLDMTLAELVGLPSGGR